MLTSLNMFNDLNVVFSSCSHHSGNKKTLFITFLYLHSVSSFHVSTCDSKSRISLIIARVFNLMLFILFKGESKSPLMRSAISLYSETPEAAAWRTGAASTLNSPMLRPKKPRLGPSPPCPSPLYCLVPPPSSPSPKERSSLT